MSAYKRILALILSLLILLSLAACAVQPGEDYSDFVPPEETDTLVVYGNSLLSKLLDNAITLFKREYPNVEVEYRKESSQDNYSNTSLNAELAAGEGPDVIVDYYFNLIYDLKLFKAMENSVYADLAPFFAWDKSIKLSDYNEAAMNAGMYKGHRYMVPLSFTSMVWVTTQEALDEAGLDIKSGRQDFMPFMDKLREYKENNPEQTILSAENAPGQMLWLFCPWCGIESVDLEEKKVTVDTEQWRALIDAYKDLFYEDDWVNRTLAEQYGLDLTDRKTLFQTEDDLSYLADVYSVLKSTQTPVLLNCPSFDGQVIGQPDVMAFIREGSPNQLNAWRFLKILLSEEIQSDTRIYGINLPVLRSAIKPKLTEYFTQRFGPETMKTEYGLLTRAEVTEGEIDAIIDIIYEIDDCRIDPVIGWVCDILMFPYIEEGSSYESCLLTLEDKLTLMLNE